MKFTGSGWRKRGRLVWLVVVLVSLVGLYSCISRKAKERADGEAARADRESARTEQKQTEFAKFSTSELARAEIERRLNRQLNREGLTLVVDSGNVLHTVNVVPVSVPWVVSCDMLGLNVQLGSAGSDSSAALTLEIISPEFRDILSAERCKEVAPILGDLMVMMTSSSTRFH
jgi:hypothetical protein